MSAPAAHLDDIDALLLASGLWAVTMDVERKLVAGAEAVLQSTKLTHALALRAVKDKMLPMVVGLLDALGLEVPEPMAAANEVVRQHNALLYGAVEPAIRRLAAAGVDVLVLKGADLKLSAFPDMPRMMCDIDLLVLPPEASHVERELTADGFVQGWVNRSTLTVAPLSADELAAFRRTQHYELPVFSKFLEAPTLVPYAPTTSKYLTPYKAGVTVVNSRAFLPVSCDVHLNVSLDIDLEDVWCDPRRVRLPSGHLSLGQSWTDMLWFLASRLYHEVMQTTQGVLRQFFDVLAIVTASQGAIDWERIVTVADKYGLSPSLYYVFWHVNEFLGPTIPAHVLASCHPEEARAKGRHDWGDFMPRLLRSVAPFPVLSNDVTPPDEAFADRRSVDA
jgi:hypothetical protein